MFTEIQATLKFELGHGQVTKMNLFKTESIKVKGKWTAESICSYCRALADKQGYQNIKLEIYFYDEDYNESYVEC